MVIILQMGNFVKFLKQDKFLKLDNFFKGGKIMVSDEKRIQYLRQARSSKYTDYPVKELTEDLLQLLETGGHALARAKGYKLGDMVEILLPTMQNLCNRIIKELTGFCRDEVEDSKDFIQEIRRGIFEALLRYKPGTIKETEEDRINREVEKEIEMYFSTSSDFESNNIPDISDDNSLNSSDNNPGDNISNNSEKNRKTPARFSSFCYFWVRKYLRMMKFSTELYGISPDFSFISEKELTEYRQKEKNGYKMHRVYLMTELAFEDDNEDTEITLYRKSREENYWQQKNPY